MIPLSDDQRSSAMIIVFPFFFGILKYVSLMCYNEVGLCAQTTYTIARFDSEHNCEGACTNQLNKSNNHDETIYNPNQP